MFVIKCINLFLLDFINVLCSAVGTFLFKAILFNSNLVSFRKKSLYKSLLFISASIKNSSSERQTELNRNVFKKKKNSGTIYKTYSCGHNYWHPW